MNTSCDGCALSGRREFLANAAAAFGAFVLLGARSSQAAALPVRYVSGVRHAPGKDEHAWPIPEHDGAIIDKDNAVIVVRYQNKGYVFNLSCPHQNTALHWEPDDNRFQCPKHHSKYQPDGIFISGRATRGMDRFVVRKDGDKLVADLDQMLKQDEQEAAWNAAFVQLEQGAPLKGSE